jgi:hypothetical protein
MQSILRALAGSARRPRTSFKRRARPRKPDIELTRSKRGYYWLTALTKAGSEWVYGVSEAESVAENGFYEMMPSPPAVEEFITSARGAGLQVVNRVSAEQLAKDIAKSHRFWRQVEAKHQGHRKEDRP